MTNQLERVGVRAVVEGVSTYVRDARRVNAEQDNIGRSADRAAQSSKRAADSMRAFGSRMRETGTQAIFLGTAMTSIAAGPAFLSARFNSGFVKIENLVGESREALQGMRQDVLNIAKDTARGPQELAEALFVIESGGLRGAEAIDTLRSSASAAALGLGETDQIARVTTQALIAFRSQNLTASDAVDILVGTARAGNFETSQLAGVFGRVLPLAAELGIRFSDLGGFVAAYTRVGGDAANATTALSAVLTTLTRGGKTATDTLASVGLSLEELRTIAREQGLAQALQAILTAVDEGGGAAEETLSLIIPNIRALRGVLATAGVQSEEFARIQQEVADSLGLTQQGLERLGEDPLFKFQQALTTLKVSLIDLGDDAGLALASITLAINALSKALSILPDPIQGVIVGMGALGGALLIGGGTIAIFLGSILNLIPALRSATLAMQAFGVSTSLLTGPLGIVALTLGLIAGAAAWFVYKNAAEQANAEQREAAIASEALRLATERTTDELIAQKEALESVLEFERQNVESKKEAREELNRASADWITLQGAMKSADQQLEAAIASEQEAKDALDATNDALSEQERAAEEVKKQEENLKRQLDETTKAMKDATEQARDLSAAELAVALAADILALSLQQPITDSVIMQAAAEIETLLRQEARLRDLTDLLLGLADPGGVLRGTKQETPKVGISTADLDSFADDMADAMKRARDVAESEVNLLGDVLTRALRRSARAQQDVAIAAIEREREAVQDAHRERMEQLDAEERAARSAIEARLEATLGPLRAQLESIDDVRDAEQRADIQRRLALAYDARERAKIEAELREFERGLAEDSIRDQISAAEEAARGEIDASKDRFDSLRDQAKEELDIRVSALDAERDAARKVYEEQTDAFALESEARRLILENELDTITGLLESHVPEWRTAGLSFSEALLDGMRAGGAGGFAADLIGGVARGQSASAGGTAGVSQADQQRVASLQVQGVNLKDRGVPEWVLDSMRDEIRSFGGVPAFHGGGIVGGQPGREVLIKALPGEGVFTQSQMAAMMRPVFEAGAFRGMFDGANFNGSPEDNADAFADRFGRTLEDVLTRGAHISGARGLIG